MHCEACRCSLLALLVLAFALSAAALALAFALCVALDAALAAVALGFIDACKPRLPRLALLPSRLLLAIVNPLPALAFPMRGIAPNLVAVAARRKKFPWRRRYPHKLHSFGHSAIQTHMSTTTVLLG